MRGTKQRIIVELKRGVFLSDGDPTDDLDKATDYGTFNNAIEALDIVQKDGRYEEAEIKSHWTK